MKWVFCTNGDLNRPEFSAESHPDLRSHARNPPEPEPKQIVEDPVEIERVNFKNRKCPNSQIHKNI